VAVSVGLISYSFYLIHWPLIVYYKYWNFDPLTNADNVLIIFLTTIIAYLMYRYIETPFRKLKSLGKTISPSVIGLYVSVFIVVMLLPAVHVWKNNGWEWRVDGMTTSSSDVKLAEDHKCIRVKNNPGCFVGEQSKKNADFLVIGDSTAGHLLIGLDYLGKKFNKKIQYVGGSGFCSPLLGAFRWYDDNMIKRKLKYENLCKDKIKQWDELIRNNTYEFVLISSRWEFMFEDIKNRPKDFLVDWDEPVPDANVSRAKFLEKILHTASIVNDSGGKLVVFSSVPIIHGKFKECNTVPTYLLSDKSFQMRCKSFSYDNMMNRIKFTNDSILKASLNYPELVISIIPSDFLCDSLSQRCKYIENGKFLYKDASHLSAYGSMYLANKIHDKFDRLLHESP